MTPGNGRVGAVVPAGYGTPSWARRRGKDTEVAGTEAVTHKDPRRHLHVHFRLRPLLLRFVVNAVSLALTAIVVPTMHFLGRFEPIVSWLFISVVFGLLNAFVKPLIQVVMLPLIFVSYGLVVVLMINSFLLLMLSWLFPHRFHVHTLLWALVGGLVCGVLEGFFQNVLGLAPRIVEGGPDSLREAAVTAGHASLEARMLAAVGAVVVADEDTGARDAEDGDAATPEAAPTGVEA